MTAPGSGPGSPGRYGQQPGASQPGGFDQPATGGQQPGCGQQSGGQHGGSQAYHGGQQQPGYGSPGQPNRSGGAFDIGSFKISDWLVLGGTLLLLIASFLPWYIKVLPLTAEVCGGVPPDLVPQCELDYRHNADLSENLWERGAGVFVGLLAILLILLIVAVLLKALKVIPASIPMPLIIAGIVLVEAILFLFAILDSDGRSLGFGAHIGIVAMLVTIAGAVMAFLDSGGAKSLQGGGSHPASGQQAPGGCG